PPADSSRASRAAAPPTGRCAAPPPLGFGVQVVGGGEDAAHEVLAGELVALQNRAQKLLGATDDGIGGVRFDRDRTAEGSQPHAADSRNRSTSAAVRRRC